MAHVAVLTWAAREPLRDRLEGPLAFVNVRLVAAPDRTRPDEAPTQLPRPLPMAVPRPLLAPVPVIDLLPPDAPVLRAQADSPAITLDASPPHEASSGPMAAAPAAPAQALAAPSPAPAPTTPVRFDADYLNNPAPEYPPVSRRLREQGTVWLLVRVTPRGDAEEVQLQRSSGHRRLDEAAIDAVRRWRFVPARRGEQPVAASVVVPIIFEIES